MAEQQLRMPMVSVDFGDERANAWARDLVYVSELERQARLATSSLTDAWRLGLATQNPQDPEVWSRLQAALFAGSTVARMLRPPPPKGNYASLTRRETEQFVKARGERLRRLLGIDEDSPLFTIQAVRNRFEHFEEYLDSYFLLGIVCLSDWYISDGLAILSAYREAQDGAEAARSVALRIFFPAGGLLYFNDEVLDLYALDIAFIDLLEQIEQVRATERSPAGRGLFLGRAMQLMATRTVHARCQEWLDVRRQAGAGIDVRVAMMPADDEPDSDAPLIAIGLPAEEN